VKKKKAFALWSGGAVLLASTGAATLVDAANAVTSSSGSARTATQGNAQNGGNNGVGGGNGAGSTRPPAKALTVSHATTGQVRLGTVSTLTVTVQNPNNQAVDLTKVSATVTGVDSSAGSGPLCTPAMFVIAPSTTVQRIAANGSTTADLTVRLAEAGSNQDRCKNATYRFTYTATANQA